MRNGDYGVKDLIDKIGNINREFILSYKKNSLFQRISSFIKEIINMRVNCDSIIKHKEYEKVNDFYSLSLLKNKKVLNSDRVTIEYCNLHNEISFFLQQKIKDNIDKNDNEFINNYFNKKIKTKGDFVLLYTIFNKLMLSIENEKNENILKDIESEERFKFISKNDLSYKKRIFKLLDSIFSSGEFDSKKVKVIKNIRDLKEGNKINEEEPISNLIKFIHNLKEKEMKNEVFLLKLNSVLENMKISLNSFGDNKTIQLMADNLKLLLPSYMREIMMNDNKSNNFKFEVNETFDSSNVYTDKIALIFKEYKEINRDKALFIKNIINNLDLDGVNDYLRHNTHLLKDFLLYLK